MQEIKGFEPTFIKKYKINADSESCNIDFYQLANRLVITDFLKEKGYKAKLLYVLFENGFEYNCANSLSATKEECDNEMDRELTLMGIKGTPANDLINWCVIDCNPKK